MCTRQSLVHSKLILYCVVVMSRFLKEMLAVELWKIKNLTLKI